MTRSVHDARPDNGGSRLPLPTTTAPAAVEEITELAPRLSAWSTVVVPTRNEAGNVGKLLSRLADSLIGTIAEILFVDDGSDETPHRIREEVDGRGCRCGCCTARKANAAAGSAVRSRPVSWPPAARGLS
jgi:hypothetical protein